MKFVIHFIFESEMDDTNKFTNTVEDGILEPFSGFFFLEDIMDAHVDEEDQSDLCVGGASEILFLHQGHRRNHLLIFKIGVDVLVIDFCDLLCLRSERQEAMESGLLGSILIFLIIIEM